MYGDLSNNVRFIKDGTAARATAVPRQGNHVQRQQRGGTARSWCGYTAPSACGSYRSIDGAAVTTAECGFPYWYMLLWGTEPVYRLIASQQTVALGLYAITGPVRASAWGLTWDDSIDKGDPAIQWAKDIILPLRRKVIRDAIRTVVFGWQPFVVSWEIRDGKYVPDLDPVLPDATTVLKDGSKFAGIENIGEDGKKKTYNDLESWAPSLDGEAGYAYGRSRLENIRTTAWAPWLNTVMRMRELEGKLAGIIPIVSHAPNGYIDDDGNAVNYSDEANTVLEELPQGRGVRLEGLFDPRELLNSGAPELAHKLAKLKVIDVDFLDAGSVSPAVTGFISLLEYWDKQLVRGLLRPERSLLEAVAAGSRADSEGHAATGAADPEAVDSDLTEDFDGHVFKNSLRLNFGDDKARRIHLVTTPLQSWKQQVYSQMLTRLVSIPDIAISVAKSLDLDAMFEQMTLPQVRDFVFEAMKTNPPADSGLKPANGNGTPRAAAEHLATLLHERFGS